MFAGVELAVFARVFLIFRANGGFQDAAGLVAGHAAVGGLFFRLRVLLLVLLWLGLWLLGLWLRLLLLVTGLILWLVLLLLFLLFLLLLPFFFGHLQVYFGIGIAGAEAQAIFIGRHGLFEFLLFKICVAKVVEGVGAEYRVFGFPGCLVKIIFRSGIVALLVNGIPGVVADDGIVLFFLSGLPVGFFCFAVMGVLILPVAFALQLPGRLGGNLAEAKHNGQ